MKSMKKEMALSIALFILNNVEPDSKEPYVSMYMRWKKERNIVLHNPENARYAIQKFEQLGRLSAKERDALKATVQCEYYYLQRNM